MAVTMVALVGNSTATDANSYATATISPSGNKLILAWVTSQLVTGPAAPTATGNGLTWVQVNTQLQGTQRTTLFRAMGASPSSGAVTFDFAGVTQSRCAWSIVEFGNVDTTGTNGSGAVVQSAINTSSGATSLTVTLAAFSSTNNATASGGMHRAAEATTPGSGFTEIHDVTIAGELHGMASEWRVDNDTTADMSWTTSSACTAVAVEIKESVPTPARGINTFGRYPSKKDFIQDWLNPLDLTLLGQSKVYGAPGQVPTYVLPNPRLPVARVQYDQFTNSLAEVSPPSPVGAKVYTLPIRIPPRTQDETWNNMVIKELPKAPVQDLAPPVIPVPRLRLDWVRTDSFWLRGQDSVFGGPGQVATFDWQNPTTPLKRIRIDHLWSNMLIRERSLVLTLDWQLPTRLPFRVVQDWVRTDAFWLQGLDAIYGGPGQVPSYDWRLPVVRPRRVVQDFTSVNSIASIIPPAPIVGTIDELSVRSLPRIVRDWIHFNEVLKERAVPLVIDWQNPTVMVRRILQHWQLNGVVYSGRDRVFAGMGQVPTFQMFNPVLPRRRQQPLLVQALQPIFNIPQPAPFSQERPVPRGRPYPIELRTWTPRWELTFVPVTTFDGNGAAIVIPEDVGHAVVRDSITGEAITLSLPEGSASQLWVPEPHIRLGEPPPPGSARI